MGIIELLVLAVGLSMDAFAVSICKGLSLSNVNLKSTARVGIWFGGFQAFMPLLGYALGVRFKDYITMLDHWIAFVLLALIGFNMIKEALGKEEEELDSSLGFKKMLPLAVATSIDALAVGVTFAFLSVNVIPAVTFIGITTFLLSAAGVKVGNIFGVKYKMRAEIFGGIILIVLGIKILFEHLGAL